MTENYKEKIFLDTYSILGKKLHSLGPISSLKVIDILYSFISTLAISMVDTGVMDDPRPSILAFKDVLNFTMEPLQPILSKLNLKSTRKNIIFRPFLCNNKMGGQGLYFVKMDSN